MSEHEKQPNPTKLMAQLFATQHILLQCYNMLMSLHGLSEDQISASEYRSTLRMDQLANEIDDREASGHYDRVLYSEVQNAVAELLIEAREMREQALANMLEGRRS